MVTYDFDKVPALVSLHPSYNEQSVFYGPFEGLAILCTYKFGSVNMGLEAYRYACNVKWLGLRGDDMQHIPEESFVKLKTKDLQIAKSLMSSRFIMCRALMPSDEESMSDEAIWETLLVPSYVLMDKLVGGASSVESLCLSPLGDACFGMDLTAIHEILENTGYKDDEGTTNEFIDVGTMVSPTVYALDVYLP